VLSRLESGPSRSSSKAVRFEIEEVVGCLSVKYNVGALNESEKSRVRHKRSL
jgi:hypothetical protein